MRHILLYNSINCNMNVSKSIYCGLYEVTTTN